MFDTITPRVATEGQPHTVYPSAYAIGDIVGFNPCDFGEAEKAVILGITFTESKVCYDIQMLDRGGEPLRNVDSVWIGVYR